jgi:hypothetical protein
MQWLGRLVAEHDNLHATVRWAISAGEARLAVRFCAALGWYRWLRGHRVEGGELAAAQELPGLPADQPTALALAMAAFSSLGGPRDHQEVLGWLLRAREICDVQHGPLYPPVAADARADHGHVRGTPEAERAGTARPDTR